MKPWMTPLMMGLSMTIITTNSPVIFAKPIVIAHRGASGYLPEHTLPAKALAYAQGADYLEQDVVMTKDNRLIVLHDHLLDRVTNVDEVYPTRSREDGHYYAIDFTLDEIRSLKFTESWHIENAHKVQDYPGRFPIRQSRFYIHTLEEEIEFIQGLNHATGKNIGIYTEIKVPWFHHQEGKDISTQVLKVLKRYGYTSKNDKVFLQCFDPNELLRIKTQLMPKEKMSLNLIQLIAQTDWHETYEKNTEGKWINYHYDWMFGPGAMKKIAHYADGIGPDYHMLISSDHRGHIELNHLVKEAKQFNLKVHPYTLRKDKLPDYVQTLDELHHIIFNIVKVDGVFSDFPDLTVKYVQSMTPTTALD